MNDYYDRIAALCEHRNIPITALEEKLDFGRGSIGKMKTMHTAPRADRLQKIADYFGVSLDYIMTGNAKNAPNNVFSHDTREIPVLGKIACGTPKYASETQDYYILAGKELKADFCLIASGDSMMGARIHNGDIVFIRKQPIVDNGDIAAVVVNGDSEATLKRFFYYKERNTLILKPENPAYEDLIFQNEELNSVRVLGKAVAFQSGIK